MAIGGLVAMGAPELADVRGAAQRVVEAAVFAWLLVEARVAGQAGPGPASGVRPLSGPGETSRPMRS